MICKEFYAEIITDAKKLNEEVRQNGKIPVVYRINWQLVLDNYYKVKVEVKQLIEHKVKKISKRLSIKYVPHDSLISPG